MTIIISFAFRASLKVASEILKSRMIIDLAPLKDKTTRFEFLLPAEEINLEDEAVKLTGAVKVAVSVTKGIAQTDVAGEIAAPVSLECSRCLEPVQSSFKFPFRAVFITPENYGDEREMQVGFEDLEVSIFDGDRIDVAELTREQIVLAIPTRIFCREVCKGLCGKCGANKNLINCNCEEKEVDPRWAALRDLK